jgi:hypothetical protein
MGAFPEQPESGSTRTERSLETYTPTGNTFPIQTSIMAAQPDVKLAPLSKVELEVLLDGETSPARAGRDLCLGVFFSGVFGLIALIATIDWSAAFKDARWGPFIWVAVQFGATLASGVGAAIYQSAYARKQSNSAYSDVVERLKGHFSAVKQ